GRRTDPAAVLRPARAGQRRGARVRFDMPPPVAVRDADRLWTLEPEAVTRHRSNGGRHMASLPAGDHRWWHHLPCPTVPFSRTPGPAEGTAGSPISRRGPSPRRPPATVLWPRLAWPPPRGGGDADAGRAGPGRRKVGGQVGEFTLPQGLVLLQAYPLGLHDRRRLIEQAGCACGGARHVTYPLPECCAPAQPVRWTVLGVDGLRVGIAGDLDTAWFGLLGDRDGQPQHPAAVAGLDRVGVQRLAQEQLPAEHPARAFGRHHLP